jgi:ABC-type phosphate transport system permease subunit
MSVSPPASPTPATRASRLAPLRLAGAGESRRRRVQRMREAAIAGVLRVCAFGAVAALLLIVVFVFREALPILTSAETRTEANLGAFLSTPLWQPVGDVPKYGITSLLVGTLKIVLVAMLFAAPVAVLAAIFASEFAAPRLREFLKPAIELLAGIPSVVLGFFNDYTSILHTASYSTTFAVAVVMQILTYATLHLKDKTVAWFNREGAGRSKAAMLFSIWLIMFLSKFVFLGAIGVIFREKVEISGFVGLLLIIASVIIGGLGFYSYRQRNKSWKAGDLKLGQKLLANFPINDVEWIGIRQFQGQLHLAKKNESWVVQERADYPANFSTISDFLRKVWEMKIAQPVRVGASQLARLELTSPEKGTNAGTLVEFKDKNGKIINSLLLGKKHMREGQGDSPFGGGSGGYPDGRYLMVGTDIKTVAAVSDPLSSIEAKPEEWLNKDFFKVENLRSISVTTSNATNGWKLERASQTNDWKLAEVRPGEQLDTGKSSGATTALSGPSFHDVAVNAKPEETGLAARLMPGLERRLRSRITYTKGPRPSR